MLCVVAAPAGELWSSCWLYASKYMHPSICTRVYASEYMHPSICIRVYASEYMRAKPGERAAWGHAEYAEA